MVTVLGANSVTGGYEVENSLRFEKGSSDSLTRTFADDGNNDKFTFSGWFKRSEIGVEHRLFSSHNTGSPAGYASMQFHTSDDLIIFNYDGNNNLQFHRTDRKFRDLSAWYHIVIAYDTTQGTASNRFKLYINGVQETSFSTATYPDQNTDMYYNNNVIHYVGAGDSANGANFLSGYVSEVCLVDNAQLAADSFGEFDSSSGIWKPIDVSGLTFGDNGFYLEYKGSGTSANASGLGADTSGNTSHFTVNNLTTVDQSTDTCTNNFATLNPLQPPVHSASNAMVLREGNLQLHGSTDGGPKFEGASTIGVSSGKWYAEFKSTISNNVFGMVGVDSNPGELARNDKYPGYYANSYGYFKDGEKYTGNSGSSYGDAWTNDIIGIALDLDNNKLYFSKNGTFQASGDPTSGATGTGAKALTASASTTSGFYFFNPSCHSSSQNGDWSANFGSPPYAISSSNADGNGFGNFEYAVPSGYFSLNTKNLAENG